LNLCGLACTNVQLEHEKHPIYNGRPAELTGPPDSIYHKAFAQLKDALQNLDKVVDPLEVNRVTHTAKLCVASTDVDCSENQRVAAVFPFINNLLELGVQSSLNVNVKSDPQKTTEVVLQDIEDVAYGKKKAIVAHVEMNNEQLGISGQFEVENVVSLREEMSQRQVCGPRGYTT
jgi:hypothetical protein